MLTKQELESLKKKLISLYDRHTIVRENTEKKLESLNQIWDSKKELYSKERNASSILSLRKQAQFEEYNYYRMRLESKLQNIDTFFDGVLCFLGFIESQIIKDDITAYKYSNLYAECVRKQALDYVESKIKILKQKNSGKIAIERYFEELKSLGIEDFTQYGTLNTKFYEDYSLTEIENWKKTYQSFTTIFTEPFIISPELIKDLKNYINYDVLEVVKNLYPTYKT